MTRVPFCVICKNYRENQKCMAFPEGIPDEIFLGIDNPKHTEIIEGQEGSFIYEEID